MHVSQNMGDLKAFDIHNQPLTGLDEQQGSKRLPEKAQQQEWLLGFYKEASIFKEQKNLNQTKKKRAV